MSLLPKHHSQADEVVQYSLKVLDKNCCNYSLDEDSVVQMGTECWLAEADKEKGVHIPIIYEDYYFTEAIYKLKGYDLLFE